METTQILTYVLGIALAMVSWWCKTLWSDLKAVTNKTNKVEMSLAKDYVPRTELEKAFDGLKAELKNIGNLELLLARNYVTKEELKDIFHEFTQKLDKIDAAVTKR